jgi:hypothetical protein
MEFKKILPHIYHLHIEDCYDSAMHFVRYQEYYESIRWRGRIFSLIDYMEYYAKEHGEGAFTYPNDWAGFNIPGNVLIEVSEADLPDLNKYDIQMRSLVETVRREEKEDGFYFIGTCGEEDFALDYLDHEIAHAFHYIDSDYREVVDNLLTAIPRKSYDAAWKVLQEMKYHPAVCRDEIHAYAATGPCDELKAALPLAVRKPFINAYRRHRKWVGTRK